MHLITSRAQRHNESSGDRGEVKRCVFMKSDTATEAGLFKAWPRQTWSCSTQMKPARPDSSHHSKDFRNVSGHVKFMLDHKRKPSHNREQH